MKKVEEGKTCREWGVDKLKEEGKQVDGRQVEKVDEGKKSREWGVDKLEGEGKEVNGRQVWSACGKGGGREEQQGVDT